MDSETWQPYQTSILAAVSKVLDADGLLIEILLRVGFPTTLVRTAAVCRRWLHHAFLRRFRQLHPPRLLGFYVNPYIPRTPLPGTTGLKHVGDNAEFVFLELSPYILFWDVKRRTVRKLYEMTKEDPPWSGIFPFMMIWPPKFPVFKEVPAMFGS
ncbi:hypothetical protein QYE76_019136 [Lolium multiflorum]|uniref:F-box protein AT5G49610-like beta-propeller domain-containing protein n=1 Tax=Lolium multiflorum TaxID=4521 RepID=A0AAD8R5X3_LOLMU|nr:hypothetical protein QYE76_019136 [Lolium multiflorum]